MYKNMSMQGLEKLPFRSTNKYVNAKYAYYPLDTVIVMGSNMSTHENV